MSRDSSRQANAPSAKPGSATDSKELDPATFLTTLPRWSQSAFFEEEIARGPGALAGLQVVSADRAVRTGEALRAAVGDWVSGCWPAVVDAIAAWPGAAAQRGGWGLIWAYAPNATVEALGAALAAAVGSRAPRTVPPVVARLVVVSVVGIGGTAAEVAIRAAEEELHSWDHDEAAAEYRWSDAPSARDG